MKAIIFSLIFVSLIFSSCAKMEQPVTGYIPVNEKVRTSWIDTPGGLDLKQTILVVTDKGDTTFATLSNGVFTGSFAVRYRDSYPPAKGKKVYVKIVKIDGIDRISLSSMEPFE